MERALEGTTDAYFAEPLESRALEQAYDPEAGRRLRTPTGAMLDRLRDSKARRHVRVVSYGATFAYTAVSLPGRRDQRRFDSTFMASAEDERTSPPELAIGSTCT